MNKSLKSKIIKGTASLLTATIILVSGGYTTISNMLGTTKDNNKKIKLDNNNKEKNTTQFRKQPDDKVNNQEIILNNIELNFNETKSYNSDASDKQYEYKYSSKDSEDSLEEYLIYELETTEAIPQEENINRLIRKRKKETQEKVNI